MNSFDQRCVRVGLVLGLLVGFAACDGDSSDPPANPPTTPTVTLSAAPTSIAAGETSVLTWSSTNATECTASQGWTGVKTRSGTEVVGPLTATTLFTLTCTGNGATATQTVTVTVAAPAGNVTVSGVISFERVPFEAAGAGLNPNAPVVSPARQVVVEVVDAGTSVRIGTTATTDLTGAYSLSVPQNRNVLLRARAEMVKADPAPTWNFRVLNNTNSDALYAIQSGAFNTGTANSTRNLRALTGWNGTTYVDADRAAAAFAILDTVYQAKELVLSAAPATTFVALDLFWSPNNRTLATPFCPDQGNIGTSFYASPGGTDDCPGPATLPSGIYILGAYAGGNGDTDEFDQHVIAHEFGHYFEDRFSRSDSIGGPHGAGDRLDMRVAFGEGWGNAYSAMTLNNPDYRDSQMGVTSDFGFSLETDSTNAEGWFSEASIGEIIWDTFDQTADAGDSVALGFGPIFAVMNGPQISTDALTSIYPFATAIRSANAGAAAGIGTLLSGELISGNDDFGTGETNDGGITNISVLPVYGTITTAGPQLVCMRATGDDDNKLGYSRFLRFNHTGTSFAITATGTVGGAGTAAATDPDIFVYRRGATIATAEGTGQTDSIPAGVRPAGTYVIEVIDFNLASGPGIQPTCMTVSVTAN